MGALNIGRVGLDLDLEHPAKWSENRGLEDREMTISGFLRATSVDNVKTLRSELLEQQGRLVAVTYSLDDFIDGFYILGNVQIDTLGGSYKYGIFPYEVGLFRIGGTARIELQSNVTGTVLVNTIGLLADEVTPFIAPSGGHLAFDWEASNVASFSRTSEDGSITVYTANGSAAFNVDATWGCAPVDYYTGSCDLFIGATPRLRSGLDIPDDVNNWIMDNGLIRVGPEISGGSTGRIEVEVYTGTVWESLKDIAFDRNAGSKISNFDYFTVLRNDPESVIVRLIAGSGAFARHQIDLQIRRGAPFVIGVWTTTLAAGTLKVMRDTAEASTAITPTGATGDAGVRATANDADGNRFVIFTPQAHTNDLVNGGVEVTTTQTIRFAIGHEINGSSAAANDLADPLALQYFGYFGERVRAVWR